MSKARQPKGAAGSAGGQFARDTRGATCIPESSPKAAELAAAIPLAGPPSTYEAISRVATLTRKDILGNFHTLMTATHQIETIRDPETTSEFLHAVVTHPRATTEHLFHAVQHGNISSEDLQLLSRHANVAIRCWAAWNDRLPIEELPRLAQDTDVNVRQGVCDHPSAQSSVLMYLGSAAVEPDMFIRQSAKDHRNYPASDARIRLAQDKKTDLAAVKLLAGDSNPRVAKIARERLAKKGITVQLFTDVEEAPARHIDDPDDDF